MKTELHDYNIKSHNSGWAEVFCLYDGYLYVSTIKSVPNSELGTEFERYDNIEYLKRGFEAMLSMGALAMWDPNFQVMKMNEQVIRIVDNK